MKLLKLSISLISVLEITQENTYSCVFDGDTAKCLNMLLYIPSKSSWVIKL